jgi:hypothetical protein
MEITKLKTFFLLYSNHFSIHFQDRTEQPHITKRRRTLATTTTTEEEEKEVVVTAGEDREEAEDEVGGVVGTATPSCERFKYSRNVGTRTSGAYPYRGSTPPFSSCAAGGCPQGRLQTTPS